MMMAYVAFEDGDHWDLEFKTLASKRPARENEQGKWRDVMCKDEEQPANVLENIAVQARQLGFAIDRTAGRTAAHFVREVVQRELELVLRLLALDAGRPIETRRAASCETAAKSSSASQVERLRQRMDADVRVAMQKISDGCEPGVAAHLDAWVSLMHKASERIGSVPGSTSVPQRKKGVCEERSEWKSVRRRVKQQSDSAGEPEPEGADEIGRSGRTNKKSDAVEEAEVEPGGALTVALGSDEEVPLRHFGSHAAEKPPHDKATGRNEGPTCWVIFLDERGKVAARYKRLQKGTKTKGAEIMENGNMVVHHTKWETKENGRISLNGALVRFKEFGTDAKEKTYLTLGHGVDEHVSDEFTYKNQDAIRSSHTAEKAPAKDLTSKSVVRDGQDTEAAGASMSEKDCVGVIATCDDSNEQESQEGKMFAELKENSVSIIDDLRGLNPFAEKIGLFILEEIKSRKGQAEKVSVKSPTEIPEKNIVTLRLKVRTEKDATAALQVAHVCSETDFGDCVRDTVVNLIEEGMWPKSAKRFPVTALTSPASLGVTIERKSFNAEKGSVLLELSLPLEPSEARPSSAGNEAPTAVGVSVGGLGVRRKFGAPSGPTSREKLDKEKKKQRTRVLPAGVSADGKGPPIGARADQIRLKRPPPAPRKKMQFSGASPAAATIAKIVPSSSVAKSGDIEKAPNDNTWRIPKLSRTTSRPPLDRGSSSSVVRDSRFSELPVNEVPVVPSLEKFGSSGRGSSPFLLGHSTESQDSAWDQGIRRVDPHHDNDGSTLPLKAGLQRVITSDTRMPPLANEPKAAVLFSDHGSKRSRFNESDCAASPATRGVAVTRQGVMDAGQGSELPELPENLEPAFNADLDPWAGVGAWSLNGKHGTILQGPRGEQNDVELYPVRWVTAESEAMLIGRNHLMVRLSLPSNVIILSSHNLITPTNVLLNAPGCAEGNG